MPRSLNKVQKHISKKRKGKPKGLHENSRDAQSLRRASAREVKLNKLVDDASRANQIYVDRVHWFKSAIERTSGPVSEDELRALTVAFITREDGEMEALKAQRRHGRPPSIQEERICQRKDAERREFRAGFWIPDLRNDDGRLKLERWTGDWAGLNALNFGRLSETGPIRPSKFPPKSLS